MSLTRSFFGSQRSVGSLPRAGAALAMVVMAATPVGASNVAVIGAGSFSPSSGQNWCDLLVAHGHECTLFPPSGPSVPLTDFDVVVDLSSDWTDPGGSLKSYVAGGGGVVLWAVAPVQLGVATDPTVQEWIGANNFQGCGNGVIVAEAAPILPGRTIGTTLTVCSDTPCIGLADTSGHPNARVVARCDFEESILILRNTWQRGRSVFLMNGISPAPHGFPDDGIILNAVRFADGDLDIPAVSTWGLVALTLLLAAAGSILLRRRRGGRDAVYPGT